MRRREERRLRARPRPRAAELAEDVHAHLQERAVAARVLPAQNRELSGLEGEMVLNGAYLVERDRPAACASSSPRWRQRQRGLGARLELGGPFPPYSFVPGRREREAPSPSATSRSSTCSTACSAAAS